MIFFDFETCGFHGMPVLLQHAEDDSEIKLHDIWLRPIKETLELCEHIANHEVCGFNLAFDWFHMQKLYSTFSMFPDHSEYPIDHIEEIAYLEKEARLFDSVIKPKAAMDLMLHARKGKYQSLMARKDIRIKRVPAALANALARELESRIEIDGIYFSGRKDKYAPQWRVADRENDFEFKDVVLGFSSSGALKVLAEHALKEKDVLKFVDIEIDSKYNPFELGYAPFALAASNPKKGWRVRVKKQIKYAWPAVIEQHISHWAYNEFARKYGSNDVKYTRGLWHFFGKPEPGDDDSELACMVGAVRFRGFKIDPEKLKAQRAKALARISGCPTSPKAVKDYISEVLDEIEVSQFTRTNKITLEKMATWPCDCGGTVEVGQFTFNFQSEGACDRCGGTQKHPAAARAQEVLEARKAKKQIELFDKLARAERFHASFRVIGTLSSRMSGADGLNAQGINHLFEIRDCFTLADSGFVLSGGDFDSFEVVLADAAYEDPNLRRDLQSGKKIHALFGMELSGLSYEEVCASKGSERDWYALGKAGVFAMIYGGDWNTLVAKQGIDPDVAQKAEERFIKKYPGIAIARQKIHEQFCSMQQPGGLGSRVIWKDPSDYVESLMGFRRYFTLENKICKSLFQLANSPPPAWKQVKLKVVRRDREQFVGGATSSAIYGASFAIQAANMRAAANHVIQSSGATITKRVQRRIWDIQPSGVHEWRVVPMNIHDEIAAPTKPEYLREVEEVVLSTVESFRDRVPLIKMEWKGEASSWATMK